MSETKDVYLITGSSGLLGHSLCHHFGSKDNLIVGFDSAGPPFPPPNTECLFCDLTDDESVQKTMFLVKERYGSKDQSSVPLSCLLRLQREGQPLI